MYALCVAGETGHPKKSLLELDDPAEAVSESSVPARPTASPASGRSARPTAAPGSGASARPTAGGAARLPFDPTAYAASVIEGGDFRHHAPTITDEDALEAARQATLPSNHPERRVFSTVPAPASSDSADAQIEIDTDEEDLDALGSDAHAAVLRDRLAPLDRVPILVKDLAELGDVLQDPKTAYVLGFVDGVLPLDTIVEVTGLPELDTLRVLERAVALGVVVFAPVTP